PRYPSAEALLADAELRLDRFGPKHGVLIVEGPNDKRLLCTRAINRQQIMTAGGRRLLLSAHSLAVARKFDGALFLTDCDYEVVLGSLRPAPSLVITKHADVEADLLDAGGLQELVLQLVPAALNDDADLNRITEAVRERSVVLAELLGRIRQVAKSEGFPI